ncbi:hypothetical protein FB645_002302 [Coemansia sp. IMI 203386]|nr:hypothetical protein FB645_002302 [Coemansia sp. IMI 203386]
MSTTTTTHQPEVTKLTLPLSGQTPELVFPRHLHKYATLEQIQRFPPFAAWLQTLDKACSSTTEEDSSRLQIDKITLQSIDVFKTGSLGFLKLHALAYRLPSRVPLPGIVFLRGGSVAILLILRPTEPNKQSLKSSGVAVMCVQPRLAVADPGLLELPAGMVDGEKGFEGVAAREIQEETGIQIGIDDLVELSPGVYPSPGACDEIVTLYACEKTMPEDELVSIQGRMTGLRDHGEFISLRLVPLDQLAECTRDMKTLAALHLWDLKNRKNM